jgi:hypothetical protein
VKINRLSDRLRYGLGCTVLNGQFGPQKTAGLILKEYYLRFASVSVIIVPNDVIGGSNKALVVALRNYESVSLGAIRSFSCLRHYAHYLVSEIPS